MLRDTSGLFFSRMFACVKCQNNLFFIVKDTSHVKILQSLWQAILLFIIQKRYLIQEPGRGAQSVGHLTRKSGVLGSIPGLATYFRFSFRFFKKGSCQLLAKVCARSTGKPLRRSKPAQEKCG